MPSPTPQRPPISCPEFDAPAGSRRCRHYLANGACQREDHFMCGEWLKVNPPKIRPPEQHQLFGDPEPILPRKASATIPSPNGATGQAKPSAAHQPRPDSSRAVHCLSEADIASFKALGVEVCLSSDALGDVWLVPEYTGSDRLELSVEHAMLLAAVGSVFPGARVASFVRRGKS